MTPLEIRRHAILWAALVALLALTVATSFLRLGFVNLVLNLGIAIAKAAIVLIFFMRLGRESRAAQLAAGAGVLWLMLLVGLSLADFARRN